MIGFETIGNATITVFDEKPVLVTDPWIEGNPYFGSWAHKYQIPAQQLENIKNAKYVWVSHGHPDHIDPDSLNIFKDKTFLIASHYGDRIYNDLKKNYKVIKLKNNSWFELSKNIRVKTFADWNQDSCLLIEINKDQIILNLNDGQALGWSTTIKNIIKDYKHKFLLALVSWGDADMINFYNNNHFIQPHAALQKPCGETYSYLMKKWGCNYAIPFSSMHKYMREDSIKMNKFITPLDRHYDKFDNKTGELLPAFINWNSIQKDFSEIKPLENTQLPVSEKIYNDFWTDDLNKDDKLVIENYFNSFHVYSIEWDLSTIKWYVDDVLIQNVVRTSSTVLDDNWPFDKEFHLILNTAVGGTLGGPPNLADQSHFMLVDYVRVYQKISN